MDRGKLPKQTCIMQKTGYAYRGVSFSVSECYLCNCATPAPLCLLQRVARMNEEPDEFISKHAKVHGRKTALGGGGGAGGGACFGGVLGVAEPASREVHNLGGLRGVGRPRPGLHDNRAEREAPSC